MIDKQCSLVWTDKGRWGDERQNNAGDKMGNNVACIHRERGGTKQNI